MISNRNISKRVKKNYNVHTSKLVYFIVLAGTSEILIESHSDCADILTQQFYGENISICPRSIPFNS